MKKFILNLLAGVVVSGSFTACHKIDVPITTQLTPNVFPQNEAQFIQAMGPAYAALRGNYANNYWFSQSQSTDEAIMPARGGNWYDNQNYRMLHYHDWTRDHGFTGGTWDYISRIIGTSNQALSILGQTMPEGAPKDASLAELRTVRAISYFMLMDLYGNVPLDTVYGDFTPRANLPRAEVFAFIERELKTVIPSLSQDVNTLMYGRANRNTAFALLAKMYINAEYYTGTARWNDCIAMCDSVINTNKYAIEPRATYYQMFGPFNGPAMKEFIFSVPFDPTAIAMPGTNGMMYRARYELPRSTRAKYSLPFTPEGPESTLPEFYAHFNDPGDIRNAQWLTGPQYYHNGQPILVNTTNKGYDQNYAGADPTGAYVYHVTLTPDIVLRQSAATFDVGNDEIGWNMGYKTNKFYPDSTSISRNQNNDMPWLRYTDIILMKAEAILRGGTPTLGHTALSLFNMVRAERTTSGPAADVTLEELYEDRCREFVSETWHRNDMIRFGKYEEPWGFKTDADPQRRIFPIPTAAFVLNPLLVQNPGYE